MRGLLTCDNEKQRASIRLGTVSSVIILVVLIVAIALGALGFVALIAVMETAILIINFAKNAAALREASDVPANSPVATVRYRPLEKYDGAVFAFEEVEAGEPRDDA